jgi:hypothetical protein
MTTVWGDEFTISLRDGRTSWRRGSFRNLRRLLGGGLAGLVTAGVYFGRGPFFCDWRDERSRCGTVVGDQPRHGPTRRMPRAALAGRLGEVMALAPALNAAHSCGAGCGELANLDLTFRENGQDYEYRFLVNLDNAADSAALHRIMAALGFERRPD